MAPRCERRREPARLNRRGRIYRRRCGRRRELCHRRRYERRYGLARGRRRGGRYRRRLDLRARERGRGRRYASTRGIFEIAVIVYLRRDRALKLYRRQRRIRNQFG